MIARLFALLVLAAVEFLPSGCASTEDTSDAQMDTYHTTPENPDDSHGWGANIQGLNGGR